MPDPVTFDAATFKPLASAASGASAAPAAVASPGAAAAPAAGGVTLDPASFKPVASASNSPAQDDDDGMLPHAWEAIKREGAKPYSQQLGETLMGAAVAGAGAYHSLLETAAAVSRINPMDWMARKIPFVRQAMERDQQGGLDLSSKIAALNPTAANIGAMTEQVAEFMGGYEIVKGMAEALKLAPEISRFGKVAYTAGRNALVGGLQAKAHGASNTEALEGGAAAGITGGALEVGAQAWQGLRGAIVRHFGVSGDLAAKVDADVARAEANRTEGMRRYQALPGKTFTGEAASAAAQGTGAAGAQAGAQAADLPHAVYRIVDEAARATEAEAARVSRPFAEIGEEMAGKGRMAGNAAEVRALLKENAERLGVELTELPKSATKALGNRGQFGTGGEFAEGDQLGFNELTRVRNDLYEAANAAKDTTVHAALMSTFDDVTQMQQKAAEAAGLGEKYAAAKRDYMKFKGQLGSGMMQDFLSARDFADAHYAGKLAKLTSGRDAAALRDVLKSAGIDAGPLDRLVADLSAEEKLGQVVPGRSNLELAGKSNAEIKTARMQALGQKMASAGITRPFQLAMTVYGLFRMADGAVEGQPQKVVTGGAMAAYGGYKVGLPKLVQSKAFQDWVVREAGVAAGSATAARLRTAIAGLAPQLQKRLAAAQGGSDQ